MKEGQQPNIQDSVTHLRDVLGVRLTAVIGNVRDARAVEQWAQGSRIPRKKGREALLGAYEVTSLMLRREAPETIQAWFMGRNPELGDKSPALEIHQDRARVLAAARAFLAHAL